MAEPLSRRAFFSSLLPTQLARRAAEAVASRQDAQNSSAPLAEATVAVVAGRHCLACQGSFCSTCVERCPVMGAMRMDKGIPMVNATLCTGCRVCYDVCPAPTKAILLVPRPPGLPPLVATPRPNG